MRFLLALCFFAASTLAAWSAPEANNIPPRSDPNLKPVTVAGLEWSGDLAKALAAAAKEKKLVLIDFTGETCVPCKYNEKNIFPKAEVKEQFKRYVRVQLYADTIPESFYVKPPSEADREKHATINQDFQKAAFKESLLPLFVIVKPTENGAFEKVSSYDEGKISKVDKFIEFLKKPLEAKDSK